MDKVIIVAKSLPRGSLRGRKVPIYKTLQSFAGHSHSMVPGGLSVIS